MLRATTGVLPLQAWDVAKVTGKGEEEKRGENKNKRQKKKVQAVFKSEGDIGAPGP